MRLIFVRHGDPNYVQDTVTEKGQREVALLTERMCQWKNITAFYTSPLGRAKATAAPTLEKLGRSATVFDWLQEFPTNHLDNAGVKTKTWDIPPEVLCAHQELFAKDTWCNNDYMGPDIPVRYKQVCDGIDGLLKEYGYVRNEAGFYGVEAPVPNHNWNEPIDNYHLKSIKDDYPEEPTLVFVCHLGVIFTIIGHLTGISPVQLWHGFYIAPTSITVLNSEERKEGQAWFRVERMGDTNHLINGGEPVSSSGYFATLFKE